MKFEMQPAVNATSKLSLNEACEAPYHLSSHLLNAGSFRVIAPAALYAAYTLMSFKRKDPFGWHACLAQLAYHVTHAYIHAVVDMGFKENTDYWNNILVFHFAHQVHSLPVPTPPKSECGAVGDPRVALLQFVPKRVRARLRCGLPILG